LESPFTAEDRTQDRRDPWSELTQTSHSVTAHYYTKHRSVKMQDYRYTNKNTGKDTSQNNELGLFEHKDFVSKQ